MKVLRLSSHWGTMIVLNAKEETKMTRDRVTEELSTFLDKQDQSAAEHEAREADADCINWDQIGEDAICNFSEMEKADQLREFADYRLAALFDMAIRELTNWNPRVNSINEGTVNYPVEVGLKDIRETQADIARENFMETGKRVWLK
jgi:hypothetical protein